MQATGDMDSGCHCPSGVWIESDPVFRECFAQRYESFDFFVGRKNTVLILQSLETILLDEIFRETDHLLDIRYFAFACLICVTVKEISREGDFIADSTA